MTPCRGVMAQPLAFTRKYAAVLIYAVLVVFVARYVADLGRPLAWPALLSIPLALVRPAWAMIGGALILRIAWVGMTPTDPLENATYALQRALSGESPYDGHVYPNGTAFVYGPLAMLHLGIPGEIMAAVGTSIVLAWRRAWVTLAVFSSVPLFLFTASTGANDHTPTFLLVLGLVLLRSHPRLGAVSLALAVAGKPYAAAWVLPAMGFGGLPVLVTGLVASAVLWSPLLVWGVDSFLTSMGRVDEQLRTAREAHASWSLDIPALRWVAAPLAVAGLFIRSWRGGLLIGCAVFAVYLGFAEWANTAHLVPLLVIGGLALEAKTADRQRPPTP